MFLISKIFSVIFWKRRCCLTITAQTYNGQVVSDVLKQPITVMCLQLCLTKFLNSKLSKKMIRFYFSKKINFSQFILLPRHHTSKALLKTVTPVCIENCDSRSSFNNYKINASLMLFQRFSFHSLIFLKYINSLLVLFF